MKKAFYYISYRCIAFAALFFLLSGLWNNYYQTEFQSSSTRYRPSFSTPGELSDEDFQGVPQSESPPDEPKGFGTAHDIRYSISLL
jgi:hypothetical protein